MPRQAKDIVKRLRFDRYPRPDAFRRLYWIVGAVAALAGVGLWALLAGGSGQRPYMPGPVAASHATFGDRCETCHDAFQPVRNDSCLACHAPRLHSEFERAAPACRDCHVDHRGAQALLDVNSASCVDCHSALDSARPQPQIAAHISGFADHPELAPRREGQRDPAALRFNHKLHLTSDKIAVDDKLACVKCHQAAADGRLMQPVVFKLHCQRCHPQQVKEVPSPIGDIEAPHADPGTVRDGLIASLVTLAVLRPQALFEAPNVLLPGRVDREPVEQARSIQEYEKKRLKEIESYLYKPFEDTAPLLERNKYCFLCHVQGEAEAGSDLPAIAKTNVPKRWLGHGEFSHRKHDKVACADCHADVEQSVLTSDTNLPGIALCQRCHVDGAPQSAGTSCMLCHVYHDTTKNPDLRRQHPRQQSLDALTGQSPIDRAQAARKAP